MPVSERRAVCSRHVYASGSFKYDTIDVFPTDETCYADPVLSPLVSSDLLRSVPADVPVSRVEKIEAIAGNPLVQRGLDVCWSLTPPAERTALNCMRCTKCLHTAFTLDLLGNLEAYAGVLDLDLYRAQRRAFAFDVLTLRSGRHQSQIRCFAELRGLDVATLAGRSHWHYPRAWWRAAPDAVRRPLRRLVGFDA